MARPYDKGVINAQEFLNALIDQILVYDKDFDIQHAADVAALLPPSVRPLMVERIDSALSPGYLRRSSFPFDVPKCKEKAKRAAALSETAREKAWASALKPFLSVYRRAKFTPQQCNQIGFFLHFALGEIQLRICQKQHQAASDLAEACQNLPSYQPSHLEWPYFRRWFTRFHELHGQLLYNYLAMLETIEQGGQISEENATMPLGEIAPVAHEFISRSSSSTRNV